MDEPRAIARNPATRAREIDGVLVEPCAGGLRITRPWSRRAGWAAVAWIAAWLTLVMLMTSIGGHPDLETRLLMSLPVLPMGYLWAGRFFNRTVIEADARGVSVRHEPLPWPGGRYFPASDVRALQLDVRKVSGRGYTVDECRILVERPDGRHRLLIWGLELSDLQISAIAAALGDCLQVPLTVGRRPS